MADRSVTSPGTASHISGRASRLAPSSERHRLTPLSERGDGVYSPIIGTSQVLRWARIAAAISPRSPPRETHPKNLPRPRPQPKCVFGVARGRLPTGRRRPHRRGRRTWVPIRVTGRNADRNISNRTRQSKDWRLAGARHGEPRPKRRSLRRLQTRSRMTRRQNAARVSPPGSPAPNSDATTGTRVTRRVCGKSREMDEAWTTLHSTQVGLAVRVIEGSALLFKKAVPD